MTLILFHVAARSSYIFLLGNTTILLIELINVYIFTRGDIKF
jgi:hypothetical protein